MDFKAINWKTFKDALSEYTEQHLQFQYAEGKLVNNAYHITEIKQAPITSVDCGGVINRWTEIIVQLWVPEGEQQERSMQVNKALSIINVVENAMPLDDEAVVKIEFGNTEFDTRQMLPGKIEANGNTLLINLRADTVQCKAESRGGTCGTQKPKVELTNLAMPAATSCTPRSGCC